MIKTFIVALGLLVALPNAEETYTVDVAASSVSWKAYKVGGEHAGTVAIQSGSLTTDGDKLVGGSFTLDMRSINVTDLEGEYKGKLEGHLKSPDFFAVEEYNTASFVITSVAPQGDQHKITGTMVIKNIAQEISFMADVTTENGQITAVADMKIDRAKFNVRYGSDSFFDNLGDKVIYDEFDLSVKLTAAL